MLAVQNAVLGALQRAQPFLAENPDALTSVDLTAVRKRLDDIIASFTMHAVEQNATDRDVKGESAKQQPLRLTLATDVMRPVGEIRPSQSPDSPRLPHLNPLSGRTHYFGLTYWRTEG